MLEQFGSYELTSRLALGGMAEIFRARKQGSAGFSKTVVIKRVLPHHAEDNDFIAMFIDEAVLVAKLSHMNVVSTIDFGEVDGTFFIAMEYVEGLDLRRLDKYAREAGEPIGLNRVAQIGIAMCRGLGHAHERCENGKPLGIVHRDVSPHNVLVGLNGDVKVTDFGIAKAMARATKTNTGVIKGKVAYMSPEQARGEPIDARTDLYATGVVLWELIAGERAFSGDSDMELLRKVQTAALPSLTTVREGIPQDLSEVVAKMTAPLAASRFARMRDAERALETVLHALGGPGAAPLDEYMARILPASVIDSLRGADGEHPHTKTISAATSAGTAVTASEPRAGFAPVSEDASSTHLLLTPSARITAEVSPPPSRPGALRWLSIGVVAAALVIGGVLAITRRAAPPQATSASQLVFAPPAPASVPVQAAAAVPASMAAAKPVSEKRIDETKKPPRAPPKAAAPLPAPAPIPNAARASVAFMKCPYGGIVFDADRRLGELTPRNARNFPVEPGSHAFAIKTAQKTFSLRRMSVQAGESEIVECP